MNDSIKLAKSSFNVCVDRLRPEYRAAVLKAIDDRWLDCQIRDGLTWVHGGELFDLAGPGADPDDPIGGCYVPPEARL